MARCQEKVQGVCSNIERITERGVELERGGWKEMPSYVLNGFIFYLLLYFRCKDDAWMADEIERRINEEVI